MPVKNTCKCEDPPGGTVECEPDQLALCIVRQGVAQKGCMDPPDDLRDLAALTRGQSLRYLNWALSQITGEIRRLRDPISNEDYFILAQGSYQNIQTGAVVTFSLPAKLNLQSPSSASGSSGSSGASSSGSSRTENDSEGTATAY
jgi:hypothetical protein